MGLRLLRLVLIPFAALVAAASLWLLVLGRSHAASPPEGARSLSLTAAGGPSNKADVKTGYRLFQNHCSFCHGAQANGSTGIAPNLQGLGPGVVQLWLSNGWMPLKTPSAQPEIKKPIFDPQQIRDVAMWVHSLRPGGIPFPPRMNLAKGSLSKGLDLFTLNCAPCHTVTGMGDAIGEGYHAPSLHGVTNQQIWEAVRSGPQNMPRFGSKNITQRELVSIIRYVKQVIQHPSNPGGVGLGGVGPVAEGFIGLFVGVGGCMLAAYWVGDRTEREEENHPGPTPEGTTEGAHA
jgi:ubiquinol-cytochrome c reductase cytochrome c subunit